MEQATCPLCSKSCDAKKMKAVYNHSVCSKCYYGFANRRQLAFGIDVILIRLLEVLVFLALAPLVGATLTNPEKLKPYEAVVTIIVFIIFCFKDGFGGCSPGKAICGVQTLDETTGKPIGFGASFKRNLPLIIPFIPIFVAFQLCKGHRLGDKWSISKVIWKKYETNPVFATPASS